MLLGLVGTTTTLVSWAGSSTLYYFALALLFGYAGFFVEDRETVRQMIEGLGVLLVVVQGISWSSLLVLGVPIGWGPAEFAEFASFFAGVLSILAPRYFRDPAPP